MRTTLAIVALILTLILAPAGRAAACNVPVFRYALERWRADAYEIAVLHRGPLVEADRAALAKLEERLDADSANFRLRMVDVEKTDDPNDQELLDSQPSAELPWLVVHYPRHLRIPQPVWSGKLRAETAETLLVSPLRKQLIERLAAGHSAVWLLLESGDKDKDDAAAKLLQEELAKQEKELKLPTLTNDPQDLLMPGPPLRIVFSVLRVPPDAAEKPLIDMLRYSEPDLRDRNDPIAFPVFGRGRALFPLVGPGITADNIATACGFLVGPCSCQVKELNPGFDLLLAANWDELLFGEDAQAAAGGAKRTAPDSDTQAEAAEPQLVPIPQSAPRAKAPAATMPVAATVVTQQGAEAVWWKVGLLAALILGGVTLLVAVVTSLQRRGPGSSDDHAR